MSARPSFAAYVHSGGQETGLGWPDDNEPYDPIEPGDPEDYEPGDPRHPDRPGDPYTGPVGPDLGRMPGYERECSPLALAAGILVAASVATVVGARVRRWYLARKEAKE